MTTEENGSTAAPDVTPAAPPAPAPKAPEYAPIEGTRHAYDSKRGMWVVERVPDGEPTKGEPTKENAEAQSDAAADDYTPQIPGHVSTSVQENESVKGALVELGGLFRESGIRPEVGQSYLDVYADYAMEHPASDVDPLNPGAVHAQLRALWGETYSTRWGHVQKAWNALSPKSQDWVANNAEHPVAMFRTLAAIGSGTFQLSREQAQAAADKKRSERTVTGKDGKTRPAPLYDLSHKDHKLYKDTFRNLSLVANREDKKGRQGNVEELVKDRQSTSGTVDAATQKLDDEIQKIRMDPQYFKSGPASKVLQQRMRELMKLRWPE